MSGSPLNLRSAHLVILSLSAASRASLLSISRSSSVTAGAQVKPCNANLVSLSLCAESLCASLALTLSLWTMRWCISSSGLPCSQTEPDKSSILVEPCAQIEPDEVVLVESCTKIEPDEVVLETARGLNVIRTRQYGQSMYAFFSDISWKQSQHIM